MKLPPELRLTLWRFTWTDRVVIIRVNKVDIRFPLPMEEMTAETRFCTEARIIQRWNPTAFNTTQEVIYTHAQLPSTFSINHESREETLRHYKLAFQLPDHESQIYFRQGSDIPCVLRDNLKDFKGCADFAEVEELMIMSANRFVDIEEYIFKIPETNEAQFGVWLENVTSLHLEDIVAVCPKLRWLYWPGKYRYQVDAWDPRNKKNEIFKNSPLNLARVENTQ